MWQRDTGGYLFASRGNAIRDLTIRLPLQSCRVLNGRVLGVGDLSVIHAAANRDSRFQRDARGAALRAERGTRSRSARLPSTFSFNRGA